MSVPASEYRPLAGQVAVVTGHPVLTAADVLIV